MTNSTGAYIVAWDFSRSEDGKDHCVLIVGQKNNGVMKIVNAFEGEEACDIYKKLSTTVKKVEEKV